ncbi:hypothetical protein CEXT_452651 [Caerostris extrusa]|uniref:Uncharacterized protein n=1 Tax=Caerostris extrusa TaxID=172846 RepID=A0AAV4VB23_CAEEX|nr:hypothetical protein CEXT_452651 [Caerostris extrusa]
MKTDDPLSVLLGPLGVPLTGKRSIAPVRQTLFLFTRQSPKKFSGDLFCSDTQTSCGISDCGIMDRCRGTYAKSFVQWSTDILSNFLCRGLGKGNIYFFSAVKCVLVDGMPLYQW